MLFWTLAKVQPRKKRGNSSNGSKRAPRIKLPVSGSRFVYPIIRGLLKMAHNKSIDSTNLERVSIKLIRHWLMHWGNFLSFSWLVGVNLVHSELIESLFLKIYFFTFKNQINLLSLLLLFLISPVIYCILYYLYNLYTYINHQK